MIKNPITPKERIIVALDLRSREEIRHAVTELKDYVGYFKVGLQTLIEIGAPQIIQEITGLGGKIFFDGKFNDIPNTVQNATEGIVDKVNMFTVHASSGQESLRAAAKVKGKLLLLAVTVLTSLNDSDSLQIFNESVEKTVINFAKSAQQVGADGIVCSPLELVLLAQNDNLNSLIKVTPGIRPSWTTSNDQNRTATLSEALKNGADYLVIGRPIMQPPAEIGDRIDAVKLILKEVESFYA